MVIILVFLLFLFFLIPIGISIFSIVSLWKVFKKAGKEGWEAIVPVYNNVVLLEITELPMWYIALLFIPFANIYASVRIYLELAYKFKQSTGFAIGLMFLHPIFIGILAFNKEITYEIKKSYDSYCWNCGTPINKDDKFCTCCGSNV